MLKSTSPSLPRLCSPAETQCEEIIRVMERQGVCFKELFCCSARHRHRSGHCVRLTASTEQWKKQWEAKEERGLCL